MANIPVENITGGARISTSRKTPINYSSFLSNIGTKRKIREDYQTGPLVEPEQEPLGPPPAPTPAPVVAPPIPLSFSHNAEKLVLTNTMFPPGIQNDILKSTRIYNLAPLINPASSVNDVEQLVDKFVSQVLCAYVYDTGSLSPKIYPLEPMPTFVPPHGQPFTRTTGFYTVYKVFHEQFENIINEPHNVSIISKLNPTIINKIKRNISRYIAPPHVKGNVYQYNGSSPLDGPANPLIINNVKKHEYNLLVNYFHDYIRLAFDYMRFNCMNELLPNDISYLKSIKIGYGMSLIYHLMYDIFQLDTNPNSPNYNLPYYSTEKHTVNPHPNGYSKIQNYLCSTYIELYIQASSDRYISFELQGVGDILDIFTGKLLEVKTAEFRCSSNHNNLNIFKFQDYKGTYIANTGHDNDLFVLGQTTRKIHNCIHTNPQTFETFPIAPPPNNKKPFEIDYRFYYPNTASNVNPYHPPPANISDMYRNIIDDNIIFNSSVIGSQAVNDANTTYNAPGLIFNRITWRRNLFDHESAVIDAINGVKQIIQNIPDNSQHLFSPLTQSACHNPPTYSARGKKPPRPAVAIRTEAFYDDFLDSLIIFLENGAWASCYNWYDNQTPNNLIPGNPTLYIVMENSKTYIGNLIKLNRFKELFTHLLTIQNNNFSNIDKIATEFKDFMRSLADVPLRQYSLSRDKTEVMNNFNKIKRAMTNIAVINANQLLNNLSAYLLNSFKNEPLLESYYDNPLHALMDINYTWFTIKTANDDLEHTRPATMHSIQWLLNNVPYIYNMKTSIYQFFNTNMQMINIISVYTDLVNLFKHLSSLLKAYQQHAQVKIETISPYNVNQWDKVIKELPEGSERLFKFNGIKTYLQEQNIQLTNDIQTIENMFNILRQNNGVYNIGNYTFVVNNFYNFINVLFRLLNSIQINNVYINTIINIVVDEALSIYNPNIFPNDFNRYKRTIRDPIFNNARARTLDAFIQELQTNGILNPGNIYLPNHNELNNDIIGLTDFDNIFDNLERLYQITYNGFILMYEINKIIQQEIPEPFKYTVNIASIILQGFKIIEEEPFNSVEYNQKTQEIKTLVNLNIFRQILNANVNNNIQFERSNDGITILEPPAELINTNVTEANGPDNEALDMQNKYLKYKTKYLLLKKKVDALKKSK